MGIFDNEAPKTWGRSVIENKEYKALTQQKEGQQRGTVFIKVPRLEMKTTLTTAGTVLGTPAQGAAPVDFQYDQPTPLPRRTLTIRQLLTPGQTKNNLVAYIKQTARSNGAATVPEGTAKPYSSYTYGIAETRVGTIAHLLKETRELFDDSASMQAAIDDDLTVGLQVREEDQMLLGDGAGANLLGMIPQATAYAAPFTPTAENAFDRIGLALLQVELALVEATGIILNPSDVTRMALLKDGTGRYIMGNPGDDGPAMLFKRPIATSLAMPAGSFLVGAFKTVKIFDREEVSITVARSNVDDFQNNLISVRAEERLALAVKVPAALVTGTLS